MTGPQLEDGYTRIANELLDALVHADLSKREYKVIFAVIRATYGYNKKFDLISLWWLAKVTGLKCSKVSETTDALVERSILLRSDGEVRHGQSVSRFGVNKNYHQWTVPKMDPVQNGTGPEMETVTLPVLGKNPPQNGSHSKNKKRHKDIIAKTSAPDDFPITQPMIEYAGKLGVASQGVLAEETEKFLLHHRAKGSKFVSWYAAWQTWIRNFVNPPWGGGKPRGHLRCDKSWMEDR